MRWSKKISCLIYGLIEYSHEYFPLFFFFLFFFCLIVKSNKWQVHHARKFEFLILKGLDIESKNILSKSWRNNQNLKLYKAKFFHLMVQKNYQGCKNMPTAPSARSIFEISFLRIIKWKNFALRSFRFLLFLQLLLKIFL